MRRIHDHGYRHNCLYAQHVFLKPDDTALLGWDIRLIDLEKATKVRRTSRATISDLSQLERHTVDLSNRDRYWLWDCYFRHAPMRGRQRLLTRLAKRSSVRGVEQYVKDVAAGRRPAFHLPDGEVVKARNR